MKITLKYMSVAVLMMVMGARMTFAADATSSISQAGDLLKKAYLAVVDAEMARSDHRDVEAASAYHKALELYGRLQAEYPGWQAAMVSYRVAECQNELATLELPRGHEGGSNAVAVVTEDANAARRLTSLLNELRDVKAALGPEKENVIVLTSKEQEKEVKRLRDELDEAVKSNQSLLRKIAKLEVRLDRSGPTKGTNSLFVAVSSAVKAEARRMMDDGKMEGATALLREAVELMPSEADLVVQLAVALCRDGKFDAAVQVLRPFDVWHPTNADAMLTLGTAYMGVGKVGEARVATEKTLKINPKSCEAHYNMAQIMISLVPPDVAGAQQHYQRALELGLMADPQFENILRTAMIVNRLKKHATNRGTPADRGAKKALPLPTP